MERDDVDMSQFCSHNLTLSLSPVPQLLMRCQAVHLKLNGNLFTMQELNWRRQVQRVNLGGETIALESCQKLH